MAFKHPSTTYDETPLGETRVIRNWKPEQLDIIHLSDEFREIIQHEIIKNKRYDIEHLEVRNPFQQISLMAFHKDNHGSNEYIVVWSNILPTLVQKFDKEPGDLEDFTDGDVIVIHNRVDEHSAPTGANNGGRWFARAILRSW